MEISLAYQSGEIFKRSAYFMYMNVFLTCVSTMCMPGSLRDQKRHQIPGTGIMNDCELTCGCWEIIRILQKQQVIVSVDK